MKPMLVLELGGSPEPNENIHPGNTPITLFLFFIVEQTVEYNYRNRA